MANKRSVGICLWLDRWYLKGKWVDAVLVESVKHESAFVQFHVVVIPNGLWRKVLTHPFLSGSALGLFCPECESSKHSACALAWGITIKYSLQKV